MGYEESGQHQGDQALNCETLRAAQAKAASLLWIWMNLQKCESYEELL
jgi:hypothetical protein